jgi:hypothetical protein
VIWLIAVAIMISCGLIKTGLGERIGYYFISIFGKRTIGIGYGPGDFLAGDCTGYAQQYRTRRGDYSPDYVVYRQEF